MSLPSISNLATENVSAMQPPPILNSSNQNSHPMKTHGKAGSHKTLIDNFIEKLQQEFSMKDIGNLNYFLRLEVTHSKTGIFLSQMKYARDVLLRADLLDSKPIATPMYLTITRPNITHAVNSMSQFMHAPRDQHFQAVKRILRYVKGTLHFGLHINPSNNLDISVYFDTDRAGCLDTSRSTSSYAIFIGNNLVSWTSKKQFTVSRSSAELEYRALALTAAEVNGC
ncbi:uncharacterized mitochondrial protein AtMg00810-like [Carya illinoinensis]|uniref:uncharacterized mitochondrial protein AtMg00810-like n=1 Tax=Carya illinoinensis TaxID=32201 RepID=UPI001C71ADAB|nr:uncharacterized mitochondrial protein AtMg00810-like [Carya illinoinensis]